MNSLRFSITNIANDSTYCDCRGRMFKFLKSSQLRWVAAVRILVRLCRKKAVTNNTLLISNGRAFYRQQRKRLCKQLTSNNGHAEWTSTKTEVLSKSGTVGSLK